MTISSNLARAHLSYSLLCDDVRLELGNKLSVMGIFQNIFFQSLPSTYFRFVLLNHWEGAGDHTTEIRVVAPDRTKLIAKIGPSSFSLSSSAVADNVTVFNNLQFEEEGTHILQVYLDEIMVREIYLNVVVVPPQPSPTVN
jgi:hypothetical protein